MIANAERTRRNPEQGYLPDVRAAILEASGGDWDSVVEGHSPDLQSSFKPHLWQICSKSRGQKGHSKNTCWKGSPSHIFVFQKTKARPNFRDQVSLVGNRAGQ